MKTTWNCIKNNVKSYKNHMSSNGVWAQGPKAAWIHGVRAWGHRSRWTGYAGPCGRLPPPPESHIASQIRFKTPEYHFSQLPWIPLMSVVASAQIQSKIVKFGKTFLSCWYRNIYIYMPPFGITGSRFPTRISCEDIVEVLPINRTGCERILGDANRICP